MFQLWKQNKSSFFLFLIGIISGFCFAPAYAWPIALLCFAFFARSISTSTSFKHALFIGFLFGLGHHLAGLYWLPRAFWQESGSLAFAIFGGGPGLLAIAAYCALYSMLTAGLTYSTLRAPLGEMLFPISFAAAWLGFEYLRSTLIYGFPWNPLGAVAANDISWLKLVALGDVWLLSFVLAFIAALISLPRKIFTKTGAVFLVVSGYVGLAFVPQTQWEAPQKDMTMLLVQGNVMEQQNWDANARWHQFQTYLDLTTENNTPEVDIVIWPETAVMFLMDDDAFARQKIAATLYPHQTLITGNPRKEKETGKFYNSMRVLNAKGDIVASYDKKLLVPFGEFVPLRRYIPNVWEVGRFVRQYVDYSPGERPTKLPFGPLTALPLICYEAIFSPYVHAHSHENDILINITNDAWFDGTTAPAQHFAMARMRAAAAKKPLIRVANTGITAAVTANGQSQEWHRLPQQEAGTLTLKLSDLSTTDKGKFCQKNQKESSYMSDCLTKLDT
jgi:apolipoprotein N-acyltransferase